MVLPLREQNPMMGGGGAPQPAPMPGGPPPPGMGAIPPPPMGGGMMSPPPPQSPMDMMGSGGGPAVMQNDPMQDALSDPMVLLALIKLIAEGDGDQNGPVYPRWYKDSKYPEPKLEQYLSKANKDKDLHDLLIKRIGIEREILQLRRVGQFPDAEDESEMQFQDPSLVHDFNLMVNLVAGCDTNFESRAKSIEDRDIAEYKEVFAHAFRERWIRRNQLMYSTDLRYDEVKIAAGTGHLVARLSLDFDAESDTIPIKADLLDPTTCFPTWDGDRGLATMTRVYSQTVGQVVASYDNGQNDIRESLLSKEIDSEDGGKRMQTMDDQVEVVEYWDPRWFKVAISGEEIVKAEHKFGFVPYVYMISSFGDAGPQSLHTLEVGSKGRSSKVKEDIASKGLSHIWATWKAHEQREAMLGRMFTELKKTGNPARTIAQDMSVYGDAPKLSDQEGAINMLRMNLEQEVPGPRKEGFSLIGPIMGATNEAAARGMMPASAYGLTQNANESGTAIEGLNESGRDKLTPWITMMERWDSECAEMAMRLYRDHGHLLGSEGKRGEFEVELLDAPMNKDDVTKLTPADLRRVGVNIRSKRTSLRLSNLGALGQSLASWKANGWILDEDALEMRGVENPVSYLRRVQIQELKKDPEYQKIAIMQMMEEEGDYVGASIYRQMITGQQSQPPPGGQPPGGSPGGMPPPDPTAPGGAGTMGGSPPGSGMGPQGAMIQEGSLGMPSRLPGPPPSMDGVGM